MINLYSKYIHLLLLLVVCPNKMWSCDCSFFQSFCTYNADVPTALISITCLETIDTFSVNTLYRNAVVNEVFLGEADLRDTILVKLQSSSCDLNIYTGTQLLIKGSSLNYDTLHKRNFYVADQCTFDYLYIEEDSVRGHIQNVTSNNIYDILFQKMQFDEFIESFPELCSTSSSTIQKPEKQLSIYPNPTTDNIFIEGISTRENKFKIYSIDGKLVKKGDLDHAEINISSLQPGLYCIIIDDSNILHSNTFVKY